MIGDAAVLSANPNSNPNPPIERILSGSDLALYKELPEDARTMLAKEALPHLEELGLDETSKGEFMSMAVGHEMDLHRKVTEESGAASDGAAAVAGVKPGGKCPVGVSKYLNALVVALYTSASCDVTQEQIILTAHLIQKNPIFRESAVTAIVWHTNSAWSVTSLSRKAGTYKGCGYFRANPKHGYDFPEPTSRNLCPDDFYVN